MLSDKLLCTSYVAYDFNKRQPLQLVACPGIGDTAQVFTASGKAVKTMTISSFYDYCVNHDWVVDTPVTWDEDSDAMQEYSDALRLLRVIKKMVGK